MVLGFRLSIKGQIVYLLGFACHKISITMTQLHLYNEKVAMDNM
jgi:hypothetical protein